MSFFFYSFILISGNFLCFVYIMSKTEPEIKPYFGFWMTLMPDPNMMYVYQNPTRSV